MAPAAMVWQLVSDATSYPVWGPWSEAGYHRPGDAAPGGTGAIRWFRYGRTVTVEEVLAAEPGSLLSYTVVRGIPVRNYLAEVTLSPAGHGTHIRWSARWDPTPGGRIVHRALVRLYPEVMRRAVSSCGQAPAVPAARPRSHRPRRASGRPSPARRSPRSCVRPGRPRNPGNGTLPTPDP